MLSLFGLSKLHVLFIAIRDAYAGEAGGAAAPSALSMGAGGARIAFHTELCPPPLSCKGAFSQRFWQFIEENFSGGKPPDPRFTKV